MTTFMRAALAVLLASCAASAVQAQEEVTLDPVVVTLHPTLGATGSDRTDLAARRTTTGDSATLLRDVPGTSLRGAGGISSLPVIHGMADDRLRVQVDGADLAPACPNHMNSPLSYADPSRVASLTVYPGVTPVSAGGDSIGGAVQLKTAPPAFAAPGDGLVAHGRGGSFYRSNGGAAGYDLGLTLAGSWFSLAYGESSSRSDNYRAGGRFKAEAPGREDGPPIPGAEVASSAYRGATHRSLTLALRRGEHELQLGLSRQTVDFEGFPNQRMDMTGNDNRLLNLHYSGHLARVDLEARLYLQDTRHRMDMGPDRHFYGTGMPMLTRASTWGATFQANVALTGRDTLRTGAEVQLYTLYDWWPAVGGSMGPNAFWNVDYGRRDRIDAFAEWEARWSDRWLTQAGVRSDTVLTDAGPVQGYDNGMVAAWGSDAAAFNAAHRARSDHNWDLTALARFTPTPSQTYEGGYARQSRSPNLYQRYPWSTNSMAALMNNFVGDGNGYVGNLDLEPEVAHLVSLTGDWHDAAGGRWRVKATGHYAHVQGYIDARRCDFGQCSAANTTASTGFVLLQYVNRTARLYGADLSGRLELFRGGTYGNLAADGTASYLHGDNLSTGDHLYDVMPPSATLALTHRLAGWSGTAELQALAGKRSVSRVRNEVRTAGYCLLGLRGSYQWHGARFDLGVENLFDRFYSNPMGGAYVGQGPSMTGGGIPWGVPIPGKGRSIDLSFSLGF